MIEKKVFCSVPFVEAFVDSRSLYRNCCATHPQIVSDPNTTFKQWWFDDTMQGFREKFQDNKLPDDCMRCQIKEGTQGHSFRTAVNQASGLFDAPDTISWPSRWNFGFGNLCNLACWACNETSSSTIEAHKKKLSILPKTHKNIDEEFQRRWPDLKDSIIKSYNDHPTITLTITGGEPLYNPNLLDFLELLKQKGLSSRTIVQFHTNATMLNDRIRQILSTSSWKYVCMFLSLDAVGRKAEWLRYGCKWKVIESNIDSLKKMCNYIEVHCTLGVLNIMDLPALKNFCTSKDLNLQIMTLAEPEYMSLSAWDGDKDSLVDRDTLAEEGYGSYYDLLGSNKVSGAKNQLRAYIEQFNGVRKPLQEFDLALARVLEVSRH